MGSERKRGDSGETPREEKMAGSIQCTQLEQEMLLARRNKEKVKEGQRTEREREREREAVEGGSN